MSTALQKAMSGEKIPDSKKNGVFAEAIAKAKSLGGRMAKAKEMTEELAEVVIATAETQGTVFAATFAEGYLGEEKMDLGPVDLRLAGGLLMGGYGIYQTMSGKGGSHALALGNGLMAAGIGRIGRHAGRALAEKKNGSAPPPAQTPAAAPAPVATPAPAQLKGDDIGEIARMVRMVPGTEGDDVAGRRRMRAHRRPRQDEEEEVSGRRGHSNRFIRARD
jgi:hypothetical protein